MDFYSSIILSLLIFVGALLYSSVGHGGGSAYIAIMALYGIVPSEIKPAALMLNIIVASIASWKYYNAGCFSYKVFMPVGLAAIPFAFIGGYIATPTPVYKIITGVILLFAAYRLISHNEGAKGIVDKIPLVPAVLSGMIIGLLSGLTGVGGGIFLSPLLIFKGWANTRTTSGVSAAFILLNSISGIIGHFSANAINIPHFFWFIVPMAILGGLIGSHIGSRKVPDKIILRLLAIVLIIAGVKLIFV